MKDERTVLRLSDSFIQAKEKACMELEAEVLNINYGNNKRLMESCRPLMEYSYFVQKVKFYSNTYTRDEAIEHAVDECIKEDVLKEILIKNRAEVVDMLLTEYDEEKRIRIMNKQIETERQEKEKAIRRAKKEQQEREIAEQRAKDAEQQARNAEQQARNAEQQAKNATQRAEKEHQEKEIAIQRARDAEQRARDAAQREEECQKQIQQLQQQMLEMTKKS